MKLKYKKFEKVIEVNEIQSDEVVQEGVIGTTHLMDLPVMVKSCLCPWVGKSNEDEECSLDQGGYFIVSGGEKVVVGQERKAFNVIAVHKTDSEIEPWSADIKSVRRKIGAFPMVFRVVLKLEKKLPRIYCKIGAQGRGIPLFVMLKALGLGDDITIIECICEMNIHKIETASNRSKMQKIIGMLRNSNEKMRIINKQSCLAYIGQSVASGPASYDVLVTWGRETISNKILPHIGTTPVDDQAKGHFVASMTRKLLDAYLGD